MGASGTFPIAEDVEPLFRQFKGYQLEKAKTAIFQVIEGGMQGYQSAAWTTDLSANASHYLCEIKDNE